MADLADIARAVAVTAELTNTDLSDAAAEALVRDLADFPPDAVLGALNRCRRELTGRLTLAHILERIDDGRPGPEEAWNQMPRGEDETVVWTTEMADAFGACHRLIAAGDPIAARQAFLEHYRKAVAEARGRRQPPKWQVSLGRDVHQRAQAITEAVERGRLTHERARLFLPAADNLAPALVDMARKALAHDDEESEL